MLQSQTLATSTPVIASLMGQEPTRRRVLLGGSVALAAASGVGSANAAAGSGPAQTGASGSGFYFAYTGCRTTRERNARGDGINVYRVEAATGHWEHVQLLGDLVNPSFLTLDAAKRTLYAVHGDSSEVSSFRVDPENGCISPLNQQSTRGKNPVHLAIDPTGRFLVIPNHVTAGDMKSSLVVLPIREDGSLGEVVDLHELHGKIGPHRVEQPFAKPHQTEFDPSGHFIVVPDKGLDVVWTFRLDEAGKLHTAEPPFVQARETSGPRHIAFHRQKPLAYVINELDSTVTGYRFDPASGRLEPFQIIPSLPESFTGNSRGSEIAVSPDGRFVYASNRGFDSVAIFAVDPTNGWLRPVDYPQSQGKTPRFFAIDPTGKFMFVANEDSDTIVTYAIDHETGKLSATGNVVQTGSPVCIVFR
jgi:6-phosphogluconolactonase (cycloisomerase 2 family)